MPWPFGPRPYDPPLVTIVLDLGNSCQCYGCLQKTSSVLNKFPGVKKHSYNLERNQIEVTGTVDPDIVVMKIAKIKKHVKVSAITNPTADHTPPLITPLENYHGMTQTQPSMHGPPPLHGHSGTCRGCDNVPPPPLPTHSGSIHGPPPALQGHSCSCCGRDLPPAHAGPTVGKPPHSHQPPPHVHNCSGQGCDHAPPPPPMAAQPPHQSVHMHINEKGKSPSCHSPPPPLHHNCVNGPPPPPPPTAAQPPHQSVHMHINEKGKSPSCHPLPHLRHNCVNGPPPPTPPTAAQPPHQPVHMHVNEKGKSPSCNPPPPLRHNCVNGPPPPPPPPIQHSHKCHESPPSSAFHCPPPQHHHIAAATPGHPPPPNNPADQLNKFLYAPSSPLITHNFRYTSILGHLAKIPKLKNAEMIKNKGVKFRLQDGQVKSCYPINHMEVRPVHDCAAVPHYHQQPRRYISPFSDENVNSSCTIM